MTWPRVDGLRTLELGTPGDMRVWLNSLALSGRKTTTTGLFDDYAKEDEPLETTGERLALVDTDGHPVGTVEITSVAVMPFTEVPWEHAAAEGEGDADLAAWRAGHRGYWERAGTPVDDETLVVCLAFRLVNATT
ncbi:MULTISPECIES: ASCH domain-containing protein [unclassified Streptomyces]|uniref:ASCH domain-containing protein n=1 Tax=unclassified Streptomyces TaxID=2593676 RepID=UPI000DDAF069|nr:MULTISPECIES: ASCH domain-containing protein [unclassified Streptomyces]QZZ25776.1 ASCH domain-containing protein [Streptomyces sp. ST1015]